VVAGVTTALRTLFALSLCDNYNRWLAGLCAPHVWKRTLEVGCGVGSVTQYLPGLVDVVEPNERHYRLARLLCPNLGSRVHIGYSRYLSGYYDAAVCINVLEHVEDDAAMLADLHRVLIPSGRLCLFVPALPWLYSAADEEVGHYRRYDRARLLAKLHRAGFVVADCHYVNPVGVFGWLAGKLLRRRRISFVAALAFDRLVPLLKRHRRPLFGLSLFVVAVKP